MEQADSDFTRRQARFIGLFLAQSPALADLRAHPVLYERAREVIGQTLEEICPRPCTGTALNNLAKTEQDVIAMRLLRDQEFRNYAEEHARPQLLTIADGIAYKVSEAHRYFLQQNTPT